MDTVIGLCWLIAWVSFIACALLLSLTLYALRCIWCAPLKVVRFATKGFP